MCTRLNSHDLVLTSVFSLLEMTLNGPLGSPEVTESRNGEPEVAPKAKRAKSEATKDIYGGVSEGVFKKLDEKTSECRVCA